MTGAMYAAIAGLKTHMSKLNVVGNNIANVNTNGYKSQRTVFRDALYTMYSGGSDGTTTTGSKNPLSLIHIYPWTETSVIYTAGYLKDCTVAVSVNADAAGDMDADTIRTHVARAAGIVGTVDPVTGKENLADKISVVTNKFYSPEVILPNTGIPVPAWMLRCV